MNRSTLLSLTLLALSGLAHAQSQQAPVVLHPAPAVTTPQVTPAPTAPVPQPAASALSAAERARAALILSTCSDCGTVQEVKEETRKGKGGAVGILAGAAAGGLLGRQVGGGTGKDIATVGGAVGGAVVGNEIQKKLSSKKVWVTSVRMKDGSVRQFEQEAQPGWIPGHVVKVQDKTLIKQ